MKLGEIAEKLGCTLEGDANLEIKGVAGIEEAHEGELTFLANRKYRPMLATTRASAILISSEEGPVSLAALRSDNPYLDFARAIELFHAAPTFAEDIHPTAVVAKSAKLGQGAHVGPYCFVDENVEIGRRAVLHSFVAIYRGAQIGDDFFAHSHSVVRENCRIGNRVILQNGVVVGSDGFGYARQAEGRWYKMRQAGTAVIEDDVEIQAGSAIDRATIGETRIGRGAKIDNLVQVGHASKVGEDTLLCGQVGLAGHLKIGDGASVGAQSGVMHDISDGEMWLGCPAQPGPHAKRQIIALRRLPELMRRVSELEKRLGEAPPPETR